jgi:alkyl sulfatase BDS1-like metallo-beta-lactamase superfamily hydrolase
MPADFADRTDFENAERGLIARLQPRVIKAADGRVVFDIDEFGRVLQGEPPETVNPSLWRQGQLTAVQGLFEVTRSCSGCSHPARWTASPPPAIPAC